MGKKERRGKKKWAMIRVTEDVRKRLEAYKIVYKQKILTLASF